MDQQVVEIREASPGDIVPILAAYDWLFAPPGRRPVDWDVQRAGQRLERLIASRTGIALVAVEREKIVGIATLYLDLESVRFGLRAWVEDLAVDPDHRSRGIGKRLLDAAKTWARRHGASHLGLNSGERRLDAHRFYEREHPTWRSKSYTWELESRPV